MTRHRSSPDSSTDTPPTGPSSEVDPSFARTVGADALFEILVDSASECFLVVDADDRVVFANPPVEGLFGYEPSEIVGESVTKLIPPSHREAHRRAFGEYVQTGERTVEWDYLEFPGLRRDGREVPLLVDFREFTRGDDRYFVGCIRDKTALGERRDRFPTEKAFVESILDALPDVVYAFGENGQFLRWNDHVNEVTGYTDEEIAEMDPLEFIPERDHERIAESIHRVTTTGEVETIESAVVTKDDTEIPYEFTGAPLYEGDEIIGETGVGRDISERKRRERQLRRLNELNTVIRSVDQALIEASTRQEIETAVCDQLVTESGYVGAVAGDVPGADESLTVNASAGVDPSLFDTGMPTGDGESSLPVEALDSAAVHVETGIQDAGSDPWRRDARDQGYDAVAAVPLVHEDRLYGVLGVYSERSDAFEAREQTILRELGEGVGNAIKGALTHQMLHANTVTEIELRSTDSTVTVVALSAEADCRLELTRAVSYGDDVILYFSVTGADPERVLAVADGFDEFESVEYFGTRGEEHRFQFVTSRGTITAELSKFGARAVGGEAESGVGYLTVRLPPTLDVRTFVDSIQSRYPETELVGRQAVEQSLQTPTAFRRDLAADMTEKQRTALEAAYFAGYFEWPSRASSAADVAAMLDIAPQTFHQHLRVAQEKLLDALFQESPGDESER